MDSRKNTYRILIKNFLKIGYNPACIHREIKQMMGAEAPDYTTVYRWCNKFSAGETEILDRPRPGIERSGQSDQNVDIVSRVIEKDRRLTIRQIAHKTHISVTSVWRILTLCLGLLLKCAKWVPKILTKCQKQKRIFSAKENLYLHSLDPDFFEGHIVTGDETYIHHVDPEDKRQSMQWLPSCSSRPEKAIRKLSAKKVMAVVFWDRLGVLLVDFFRKGRTMTGAAYVKILEKLRKAIQRKRGNMWDEGVFLLHDNAPSHTSKISKAAISELGFTELDHPPYSPDLAPSDYFLFPNMKKHLRKKTYTSDDQVENATKRWLANKPESFYSQGISKLKHRWEKCIKVKGAYVEY